MRFLPIIFLMIFSFSAISCASDDDICTSGEATPRMKIKFKDSNKKLTRLDSLIVNVKYADGEKTVVKKAAVDSVLIPLRVDESSFTEMSVRTSSTGPASKLKVSYTSKSAYVSPACGIKKVYEGVKTTLLNTDPVKAVEENQTQIINENKTHLYLIF